jgi:hypothetical protein
MELILVVTLKLYNKTVKMINICDISKLVTKLLENN